MISIILSTPLAAILGNPRAVPLTLGPAAATELGLAALEHLEGAPSDSDVRSLVAYAARHDESAPGRDALVAVLLNASGTLPAHIVSLARAAFGTAEWGKGRESAALACEPSVSVVPRRQALAERLLAERARRLRPLMHGVAADIFAKGAGAAPIPTRFLDRNWLDLRDALAQRARIEPDHRESIAQWLMAQDATVHDRFTPVEEALIDVATQAILHAPERAPLAPYLGADVVAARVRTAVNFRGEAARTRVSTYLARLAPGTPWYETIREMTLQPPRGTP